MHSSHLYMELPVWPNQQTPFGDSIFLWFREFILLVKAFLYSIKHRWSISYRLAKTLPLPNHMYFSRLLHCRLWFFHYIYSWQFWRLKINLSHKSKYRHTKISRNYTSFTSLSIIYNCLFHYKVKSSYISSKINCVRVCCFIPSINVGVCSHPDCYHCYNNHTDDYDRFINRIMSFNDGLYQDDPIQIYWQNGITFLFSPSVCFCIWAYNGYGSSFSVLIRKPFQSLVLPNLRPVWSFPSILTSFYWHGSSTYIHHPQSNYLREKQDSERSETDPESLMEDWNDVNNHRCPHCELWKCRIQIKMFCLSLFCFL